MGSNVPPMTPMRALRAAGAIVTVVDAGVG
jgi:hypothetical protein